MTEQSKRPSSAPAEGSPSPATPPSAATKNYSRPCTCPHGKGTGAMLHGIHMPGGDNDRLSTTKGCPEHDGCHNWTAQARAEYASTRPWTDARGPWCPIHRTKDCPVAKDTKAAPGLSDGKGSSHPG